MPEVPVGPMAKSRFQPATPALLLWLTSKIDRLHVVASPSQRYYVKRPLQGS
jgi:hypothetical protein